MDEITHDEIPSVDTLNIFSGGPDDRLAPRIARASEDQLNKLEDTLDKVGTSSIRPSTWSEKRMFGIRNQIQNRYKTLRGTK